MVKRKVKMTALILLAISIILGVTGQLNMKKGMNEVGRVEMSELVQPGKLFDIFTNKFVFLGVVAYVVALVTWLGALSILDLSKMYPLLSIGYVLVAIGSFVFLGENISAMRWLGTILIVLGSFLVLRT